MTDPDHLRVAAHHLLAAARPDNPNPTPSTLAAALAMSQAGAWVTWTETQHDETQIIRAWRGDLVKATIMARSVGRVDGSVWIAWSDELTDHVHQDADALTAALRALLEVTP